MEYCLINGELYHYGVKGMRWGHRKRQEDINAYKKSMTLRKKADAEGERLMSKSKALSKEFGGKYSNVDDTEFFELQARSHGLNTDAYWKADREYSAYYKQNRNAIQKGQKAANKVTKSGKQSRRGKSVAAKALASAAGGMAVKHVLDNYTGMPKYVNSILVGAAAGTIYNKLSS